MSVDFQWRYKLNGKTRQVRIGSWPKMSFKALRDERDRLAVEVKSGTDPVQRKASPAPLESGRDIAMRPADSNGDHHPHWRNRGRTLEANGDRTTCAALARAPWPSWEPCPT